MTSINQKEYLKKYLAIGKTPGEKKKKKRKEKALSNRLKIIDDDIDVLMSNEIQEDIAAANEDAPQIVAIIDERPISLQIDEKTNNTLWKPIGEASITSNTQNFKLNSFKLSKENSTDTCSLKVKSENRNRNYYKKYESTVTRDSDANIKRRNREKSSSPIRKEKDYNFSSSQNLIKNDTPTRAKRTNVCLVTNCDTEEDDSPLRRKNKNNYSSEDDNNSQSLRKHDEDDNSPPRRIKEENFPSRSRDNDNSPPRKRYRDDSPRRMIKEENSPRRKNKVSSPPRRRHGEGDNSSQRKMVIEDNSPARRKNKDSNFSSRWREDNSPLRRREDNSLLRRREDNSPPRRLQDNSPLRRRQDNSPLRRGEDNSPPRRQEDNSPPRRKTIEEFGVPRRKDRASEATKDHKRKKEPKKSRWDSEESSEVQSKIQKTLDGKQAGLQKADDLWKESKYLRQKEDEVFRNMAAEVSGRNAATVVRAKKVNDLEEEIVKVKRQKELKEKYDRWGKGLKQMEDRSQKIEEQLHEMSKPLARYADDKDLEKFLKEQEREGDPMLAYIRKKKKKEKVAAGIPEKPMYMGEFMPNRFGIPPGYRWDGVDRSNGYEKKWFEIQNAEKANQEDAFKWSTEEM